MHALPASTSAASDPLAARYAHVRAASARLAAPLSAEDAMVQSMEDASPAKWHLAHTSWFFDRFVLQASGQRPLRPHWEYLLNSYYDSAGPRHPRPRRGVLSRPSLEEVRGYRSEVDAQVEAGLRSGRFDHALRARLQLGLHHEQQHQELLLTDIKHALWSNPLQPAYRDDLARLEGTGVALQWLEVGETITSIGAAAWPEPAQAFAYDNESPRHRVLLPAHALANRPVSNGEYRAFIEAGGYRDPRLWLSDGWAAVQAHGWERPLYWHSGLEHAFTLGGVHALDPHAPVCHLSYYEADAYARWAGARLPTEGEWEHAAGARPVHGNFADAGLLEPVAATPGAGVLQLFGDTWEWTSSAYGPYPGYRPWAGDTGEYNGKFMCGQWVLRGGSCATPGGHVRASYRNFFPPGARWQFAGVRLCRSLP